jgi:hypothetical protein
MKINRESLMSIIKPVLNTVVITGACVTCFQLGSIYQAEKSEDKATNPYSHAFSPSEISIAVNESNELIMIERATGNYIVYSDTVGQTIFNMYANRIHQEVSNGQ